MTEPEWEMPDSWWFEGCTLLGFGHFPMCSACQYPPCHMPERPIITPT